MIPEKQSALLLTFSLNNVGDIFMYFEIICSILILGISFKHIGMIWVPRVRNAT